MTTLQDGISPGGISTFATIGQGKNWWKLDSATDIPAELKLVNDRDNHWLWQPHEMMLLEDYKTALRQIAENLYKIS